MKSLKKFESEKIIQDENIKLVLIDYAKTEFFKKHYDLTGG